MWPPPKKGRVHTKKSSKRIEGLEDPTAPIKKIKEEGSFRSSARIQIRKGRDQSNYELHFLRSDPEE